MAAKSSAPTPIDSRASRGFVGGVLVERPGRRFRLTIRPSCRTGRCPTKGSLVSDSSARGRLRKTLAISLRDRVRTAGLRHQPSDPGRCERRDFSARRPTKAVQQGRWSEAEALLSRVSDPTPGRLAPPRRGGDQPQAARSRTPLSRPDLPGRTARGPGGPRHQPGRARPISSPPHGGRPAPRLAARPQARGGPSIARLPLWHPGASPRIARTVRRPGRARTVNLRPGRSLVHRASGDRSRSPTTSGPPWNVSSRTTRTTACRGSAWPGSIGNLVGSIGRRIASPALPESDPDARAARAEIEFDRGDMEAVSRPPRRWPAGSSQARTAPRTPGLEPPGRRGGGPLLPSLRLGRAEPWRDPLRACPGTESRRRSGGGRALRPSRRSPARAPRPPDEPGRQSRTQADRLLPACLGLRVGRVPPRGTSLVSSRHRLRPHEPAGPTSSLPPHFVRPCAGGRRPSRFRKDSFRARLSRFGRISRKYRPIVPMATGPANDLALALM